MGGPHALELGADGGVAHGAREDLLSLLLSVTYYVSYHYHHYYDD